MDYLERNFQVLGTTEIIWDKESFADNLSAFYGEKLPKGCHKEKEVGKGPFLLVYILDKNPLYKIRRVNSGDNMVNVNVFDAKEMFRCWLGSHNIHSSNCTKEVEHDLMLLLGMDAEIVKQKLLQGQRITNR